MVTRRQALFIPLVECKHGHLYKVLARNFSFGIFDIVRNTFIGMNDKFLDTEDHWDYNNGSAKPIELICVYPKAVVGNQEMLEWLKGYIENQLK